MKQRTLNGVLVFVLVLLVTLTWVMQKDPAQPGYQFLPEMVYSVPYDAYSANPNFPDGKTPRTPVEGTIPRGMMPLHYEKTDADAKRAGEELKNPFPKDSSALVDRGARLYRTFCQPCHGESGKGDGTVTKYGFPPPPSFMAPNLVAMKDGQIFHTITYGKGNMPSLAPQIPRDDRWLIILKVRSLQEPGPKHTTASRK
ncbi:MAG: c-type cytochrome [Ignavibacterium sp.]|jgi:mono/diheme cytochrome c family protein